MNKDAPILTVSQLTHALKLTLESTFPLVWIQGEVSNFRAQSSGHYYFTLKDAGAQISAVMFRGDAVGVKRPPRDGDKVIVRGELNVYERSGKYQIVVRELRLEGLGELLIKLEELKAKIHKKGWFNQCHKQPLPELPKTIGVVTSPTGAAIRDILHVLTRRFAGFELILNPVRVQGDEAASEIARAIEQFNRYRLADVLIVGRGGGSIEDLWAFNEEIVAKSIFESAIPIIAAVGHETDHCIAEYVADARAATPSAAAEIVISERAVKVRHLGQLQRRLQETMSSTIRQRNQQLNLVKQYPLYASPLKLIEPWAQKLDELQDDIDDTMVHNLEDKKKAIAATLRNLEALKPTAMIARFHEKMLRTHQQLTASFTGQLQEKKRELQHLITSTDRCWQYKFESRSNLFKENALKESLFQYILRIFQQKSERFQSLKNSIRAINPKQLLSRGYSILFSEKEHCVINSVQQLQTGGNYRLMMADGEAKTTIKEVLTRDER